MSKLAHVLIGSCLGGLVLHLYSMIGFTILTTDWPSSAHDYFTLAVHSFQVHMLPMLLFYAAFGGFVGYIIALLRERDARIAHEMLEIERHRAAQAILEEVVLTVSHYIRNANSLIGGNARRILQTRDAKDTALEKITLIKRSSDKIEAVVSSLAEIGEGVQREEVGTTHLRMLDIRESLKRKIEETQDSIDRVRVPEQQSNMKSDEHTLGS